MRKDEEPPDPAEVAEAHRRIRAELSRLVDTNPEAHAALVRLISQVLKRIHAELNGKNKQG